MIDATQSIHESPQNALGLYHDLGDLSWYRRQGRCLGSEPHFPRPATAASRDFRLPGALWLAAQQTGLWEVLETLWPALDPLATGEDGPLDLAQLLLLDLWKSQQMVSRHLLAYDTISLYTYIASSRITYESRTMHQESSGLHLRMGPFPGNLTLSSPGSGWS